MDLSNLNESDKPKAKMLVDSGYTVVEGWPGQWWFRGHRIGRLPLAVEHCQARQEEIAKACVFLTAEGYGITPPESLQVGVGSI